MSTEGEVMDGSGAPVTDELTGVLHSPQRDAIYELEKTGRHKALDATVLLNTSSSCALNAAGPSLDGRWA